MLWIIIVSLLSVLCLFGVYKLVAIVLSKIKRLGIDDSAFGLIIDFPKVFLILLVVFVGTGLYQVKYQMGQMFDCSKRASIQNLETQYTWMLDSCQFKNERGQWIDFRQIRSNPGDSTSDSTEEH